MILRNRKLGVIFSVIFLSAIVVGYMNCGVTSGSPFNILLSPTGSINNSTQVSEKVTAGYDHSCAINGTGQIKCWGDGQEGQLGNGAGGSYTASPVSGLSGTPLKVVASQYFTCAMLVGGSVECWGSNSSGQIGNNTPGTNQYNSPEATVNTLPAYDIAASSSAVCIVTQSGIVQCWGSGAEGQLGNNATANSYTPVTVYGITNATAITGGLNHFCALLSTGTISCWGSNSSGQLGNNTTTSSYVAVATLNISNVTKIVAANNDTCAIVNGGALQCWGDNSYEQLGNSNDSEALVPLTVTGVTGVIDVSVGYGSICAVLSNGTVKCIGYNQQGQLGNNNSTTNATAFVSVQKLGAGVVNIASNYYHVCALLNNGNINCWGYNNEGQIGNNTTTDATTAQAVQGFP